MFSSGFGFRLAVAGSILLAPQLAACGDDDDGGSSTGGGAGMGGGVSSNCPVPSHAWPSASGPPRVFFTDLLSGPNTGGEQNLGAFVTIYGEGFGAAQGDSTVTVGGQEVARYLVWGENNAFARGLDQIVVQLGPMAASGDIVVSVAGQASAGVPFVVRPGAIYFVNPAAPGASDSNDGSAEAPFATIWAPRAVMAAGDIVYIRGNFPDLDPSAAGWDTNLFLSGGNAKSGTPTAPVAYVGHPGASPTLGSASARRGILLNQDEGPLDHYVIANLVFTGVGSALPLTGVGQRVVGSCFFDGGEDDSGMIGINGAASQIRVLGALMVGNGLPAEKLHHAFYIGGFGVNQDIELGFSQIERQEGGRSVQIFGHVAGDVVDGVVIHDNLLIGAELDNITLGGSDANGEAILGTVEVYNNVILDAAAEGLRINDLDGTFSIRHNTLRGNASAQLFVERASAGRVVFENNLLVAEAGQEYVAFDPANVDQSAMAASHALCFGNGGCPAWITNAVTGDPMFAGELDFGLTAGSPAIDAGKVTNLLRDHVGTTRPAGGGFDIGAFERP